MWHCKKYSNSFLGTSTFNCFARISSITDHTSTLVKLLLYVFNVGYVSVLVANTLICIQFQLLRIFMDHFYCPVISGLWYLSIAVTIASWKVINHHLSHKLRLVCQTCGCCEVILQVVLLCREKKHINLKNKTNNKKMLIISVYDINNVVKYLHDAIVVWPI